MRYNYYMSIKNEKKATVSANIIDEIKKEINKEFGAGSVFTKNDNKKHKDQVLISTGSILLDNAIGGGLPRGRILEIFGPESSGKTTIALHAVREVQKKGGIAAFIDVEHALDMKYAERIGVDTNSLLVSQPNSGEEALTLLESLAKKKVDIVVLDSVAALVTKAEIEGAMGDAHIGLQARLMSQALKKIVSIVSEFGTIVIFTNQIRSKIGVMYGNPETTCGGNALKFYSSIRLDVRKIEIIKKGNEVIGIKARVKVIKNKCAAPFKEAIITIIYNAGINILNEIIDLSLQFFLIQRSGAWYSKGDIKLGQGVEAVAEYLTKNPAVMKELKTTVEAKLEEQASQGTENPPENQEENEPLTEESSPPEEI
jgi:recombination protein RecA